MPWHNFQFESEFLPFYIKLIPVVFSISGAMLSFFFYKSYQFLINLNFLYKKNYNIYHFLSYKWYFDEFYNKIISNYILYFGYQISFKVLDRGLIELLGPFGIIQLIKTMSKQISKITNWFNL